MAKRYCDTNIWDEDWFILMPPMYRLLWRWVTDKCDHAGIWKPNLQTFIKFNGEVDLEKALEFFNEEDKVRLTKLKNGKFFLPGFFVFQYGEKINLNNKVHKSIYQLYITNEVKLESIRGLKEVIQGLKDKDIDKEKDKDKIIKKGVKPEKPIVEKIKYAPFVSMTDEEHSKLIQEHGPELTQKFILKLDNYKGSNGKTYKDDYRAILSWVVDEIKKEKNTGGQNGKISKVDALKEQHDYLQSLNNQ